MVQKAKGREHWPSDQPWMKHVKEFSHRKNRQTTRQLLHHEKYDDIPQNHAADIEDSWAWN